MSSTRRPRALALIGFILGVVIMAEIAMLAVSNYTTAAGGPSLMNVVANRVDRAVVARSAHDGISPATVIAAHRTAFQSDLGVNYGAALTADSLTSPTRLQLTQGRHFACLMLGDHPGAPSTIAYAACTPAATKAITS